MVFVKQTVITPYGKGIVEQVTEGKITVRPSNWLLANDQQPIFYMNPKDVKPFFNIGDRIKCAFGFGVIDSIRDVDGIYVATLTNWALADGKSPTLYLNEQALTKEVVEKEKKPEKKLIGFNDVYPQSLQIKDSAKDLFQEKRYTEAKIKYLEALEKMRVIIYQIYLDVFLMSFFQTIETELSNDEKAKFVEMSVFSHSNLALCAFYESDFSECIRYGESVSFFSASYDFDLILEIIQTINLIEAIEKQDNSNVLLVALQANGTTAEKLKDQKAKVWRIVAKAEVKRQNYEKAQEILKSAIAISSNEKMKKELNDLLVDVTKKLSLVKKKEKSMWQKAFKKGSEEPAEEITPPPSPTKLNPPSANGHSFSISANGISDNKINQDVDEGLNKLFPQAAKKPKSQKSETKEINQQLITSNWSNSFLNTAFLAVAVGTLLGGIFYFSAKRIRR